MRATTRAYQSLARSKPRLNQRAGAKPTGPLWGRSSDAVCAGVRISATARDSTMALMMVIENWR